MKTESNLTLWAFRILHVGFSVAPLIAGLDKFTNILTNWEMYLSPFMSKLLPVAAGTFMRIVGVIEIIAAIIVMVKPKIGGLIVAGWLFVIIINLLLAHGFYDIALRDFGLALGAISLALLGQECECEKHP